MCVFGALVVVCNESRINAPCFHMRDQRTTTNTEQMDTRIGLLEKVFSTDVANSSIAVSERGIYVHREEENDGLGENNV